MSFDQPGYPIPTISDRATNFIDLSIASGFENHSVAGGSLRRPPLLSSSLSGLVPLDTTGVAIRDGLGTGLLSLLPHLIY